MWCCFEIELSNCIVPIYVTAISSYTPAVLTVSFFFRLRLLAKCIMYVTLNLLTISKMIQISSKLYNYANEPNGRFSLLFCLQVKKNVRTV